MNELSHTIMNATGTAWPWMLTGALLALAGAVASSTTPLKSRRERRHKVRQREEDDARKRGA